MALALLMSLALATARYSVTPMPDRVEIADRVTETVVAIAPQNGNNAFSMKVKGREVLWWNATQMSGIPFLGPWANRLDEQAFYANGRRYPFDMALGNVRGEIPIHGFLATTAQWQVVEVKADGKSSWVTSRLDFFKQPAWMKQFPFAHTIEM